FLIHLYNIKYMQQVISHIDMDCFFCACEEKKDPALKGKPVIVGSTGERGVVSAANYEARKYKVFSATPIGIARQLCPKGIYLPVDGDYYRKESRKIMNTLTRYSDSIRQVSVDEAYLDLTSYSKKFESLQKMAESIRKTILTETKLSCSIGVSESRIVAKIASDFRKPGGITIVEDMASFLKDMDIGKIPGIGKRTEEMYIASGIEKVGDFLNKKNSYLYEKFGNQGLFYKRLAEGLDKTTIEKQQGRKSVSRETTLGKNTANVIAIEKELEKICKQVYADLKDGFFKTVSIKIRYQDFTTLTRDKALMSYENSLKTIRDTAFELFRKNITSVPVRLIGVKLGNIIEKNQKTLEKF
ncbi:MAG: DNA polymerase IV, partial [Nanoarchaeota archaeon]